MRKVLATVALVTAGIILSGSAIGEDRDTVMGRGKATVMKDPDVAYVTLFIQGDGMLMADAIKQAEEKSAAVEKAITENCPQTRQIEIIDLEVGDKASRFSSSQSGSVRPQLIKRVLVTIPPDPALASRVIDQAIRAGAVINRPTTTSFSNKYSAVMYGLVGFGAAEDEARKLAFEEAKLSARKLAELAGKKLGEVISISSSDRGSGMVFSIPRQEAEFPTEYLSKKPTGIEVISKVAATFELVPE